MRSVNFAVLTPARGQTCHAGMMSKAASGRCKAQATWSVTYYLSRTPYRAMQEKWLCTKHAARFAARHGGGTIDVSLFGKETPK